MMKFTAKTLAVPAAVLAFATFCGTVSAQEIPGHPRVNEIQSRIGNQERRMDAGVNQGQINPNQAARDMRRDARVERQLQRDEAKHGGHITAGEQARLNRELNRNSRKIYRQRH